MSSQMRTATVKGSHISRLRRAQENGQIQKSVPATLLYAEGLQKSYQTAHAPIPVLRGVDFSIAAGHFMAIVGQSGSGKSTLLHLLATLDQPDAGTLWYEGNRIDNLSARGRDILRNRHFGIVFQFYHLLPELNALENVLLPSMISSGIWQYFSHRKRLKQRASELLKLVGLADRMQHRPRQLSGGEMQRVAIARALMSEPRILFADEPTGNLDRNTGDEILKILHGLNEKMGLTIVMVTHDQAVANSANRVVRLVDSRIQQEIPPSVDARR